MFYIKSKNLLPKQEVEEEELTQEELIHRIIEYKKFKEISKIFKERIAIYSNRVHKFPENIELPKQTIEKKYTFENIVKAYSNLLEKEIAKKNENAQNIEKIAVHDVYSVSDKVKDIFRELIRKPKFVFNKLFSLKEKPKAEVVTAFSGVLELSRRSKINTSQEELFGDIVVSKRKNEE